MGRLSFLFLDRYQHRRNRNPGAAKGSHAQPFGNVPAVARWINHPNRDAVLLGWALHRVPLRS